MNTSTPFRSHADEIDHLLGKGSEFANRVHRDINERDAGKWLASVLRECALGRYATHITPHELALLCDKYDSIAAGGDKYASPWQPS